MFTEYDSKKRAYSQETVSGMNVLGTVVSLLMAAVTNILRSFILLFLPIKCFNSGFRQFIMGKEALLRRARRGKNTGMSFTERCREEIWILNVMMENV